MSLCNLFLSLTTLPVESVSLFLSQISCVLVCTLILLSAHWALFRRLYSFCFGPSCIFLDFSDAPDPARLQAKNLQFSQHFLVCQLIQPLYHLCDSLLSLLQYMPVCLVLGRPKQDAGVQIWLSRAEQEKRITSLHLLTALFPMQPQVMLFYFTLSQEAHCWLMSKFLSTRTVKQICFSGSPACAGIWDYSFLGMILCILCRKLDEVPVGLFLQFVDVLLNGSSTIWSLKQSSKFDIVCKLRVCFCHIAKVIPDCFKMYWTLYQPLRAPLLTVHQLDFMPLIIAIQAVFSPLCQPILQTIFNNFQHLRRCYRRQC